MLQEIFLLPSALTFIYPIATGLMLLIVQAETAKALE